jgi:exodeoxyribonuclease V alpha subunit
VVGDDDVLEVSLLLTSTHRISGGRVVLIGRDQEGKISRVVVEAAALGREPNVGETWWIEGTAALHDLYGPQIKATKARPQKPITVRGLQHYLASGKSFVGIGRATAATLAETFGVRLFDIIASRDIEAIAKVVGLDKAFSIVDGLGLFLDDIEVLQWMEAAEVPANVAGAAAALWGRDAIVRFREDPYVLLMFEDWAKVDGRALRNGVPPDDARRMSSAVEEALSLRYRQGHMASPPGAVTRILRRLLTPLENLAASALEQAKSGELIFMLPDGSLQSRACKHIEDEIFAALRVRLSAPPRKLDMVAFDRELQMFESRRDVRLDERQVLAVEMALRNGIGIVSGSAGTGKTAVVSAILELREVLGLSNSLDATLTAVAGRAAQRLKLETGRNAVTAARLARDLERADGVKRLGLLVFDEASMLDSPLAFRLLTHIAPETDLLFVGDTAQLPPIGAGRLFHTMVQSTLVPRIELLKIHRQAEESSIPSVAGDVRHGEVPNLPSFDFTTPLRPGVFIHETDDETLQTAVLDVYAAMCGPPPSLGETDDLHSLDVQILAAMKRGECGFSELSAMVERRYMVHQRQIANWGVHVGSRLLWLKNDYNKAPRLDADGGVASDPTSGLPIMDGFMNGAIGVVCRETEHGAWVRFDDGMQDEIKYDDLAKFTHGWAMSVHKAQGSAFRRVIFPITGSRLLDRALIYTAITRAKETVVLVGRRNLLKEIVAKTPTVDLRGTSLKFQ